MLATPSVLLDEKYSSNSFCEYDKILIPRVKAQFMVKLKIISH